MAVHTLILPDGGQISSGTGVLPSLQKVTLTQKVNTCEALTCGSVFSACLEVSLLCDGDAPIRSGDRLALFRGGEKQGVFYAHALEKTGKGIYKLTAYDSLSLLDTDISAYLASLSHWPYTIRELSRMVCEVCGLTMQEEDLPQGDFPVEAFAGEGITGRMVLGWIGQAIGRFCRATPDGKVEFAWYTTREVLLKPGGEGYYFRGSFCRGQEIPPIDQVRICRDSADVGTVYPEDIQGKNVYVVEGNPLLAAKNGEHLQPLARALYEILSPISYSPGQVSIPGSLDIGPGQIVGILDTDGVRHTFYVMGRVRTGSKDSLTCTGVQNREKASIANRQEIRSLSGKLLHLQMDVDGIFAENRDTAGALSQMEMEVNGIRTQVLRQQDENTALKTQVSMLEQDSEKLSVRLSQIAETGAGKVTTSTGYRFDGDGLWISKSGEEMENKLDNTGMYVRRSGQVILQANNRGVEASDVTVRNYLTVGRFARFEDYSAGGDSRRTACFWIGETL